MFITRYYQYYLRILFKKKLNWHNVMILVDYEIGHCFIRFAFSSTSKSILKHNYFTLRSQKTIPNDSLAFAVLCPELTSIKVFCSL
jgi:hypothetical protein